MYCYNCGKELPDIAEFCTGCGKKTKKPKGAKTTQSKSEAEIKASAPIVHEDPKTDEAVNKKRKNPQKKIGKRRRPQ